MTPATATLVRSVLEIVAFLIPVATPLVPVPRCSEQVSIAVLPLELCAEVVSCSSVMPDGGVNVIWTTVVLLLARWLVKIKH